MAARIPRNPAWTSDELIVALDVYVNAPAARSSKTDTALAQASEILRSLPLHVDRGDPVTFRNINSVYLKLQNFKALDPAYPGKGMTAGAGPREQLAWDMFANRPAELRSVAMAIAAAAREVSVADTAFLSEEAEDDRPVGEGRILLAWHRTRERRRASEKKAAVLRATGRLACEVCGFDFEATYGGLGRGFAECHHKLPLSEGVRQTRLSDLAIVCSNCHRMLHRDTAILDLAQLRRAMSDVATSAAGA